MEPRDMAGNEGRGRKVQNLEIFFAYISSAQGLSNNFKAKLTLILLC